MGRAKRQAVTTNPQNQHVKREGSLVRSSKEQGQATRKAEDAHESQ